MRRLFIILFVLLASISAFSQADDTTKYIKYPGVYGIQYPRYMATKVLRPPVDTIYSKSGLAIIGAVLYYGDGVRWRASAAGGSGTVTSVGLSMPSGFSVTGSPVTGSGTLAVTGAGTTGQVILGDGSLGTFNPWNRNGNSGTTVGTDFFGTTDDESLMLKVNNVEAGYLRSIVTGYNNAPGGGLTSYGQYALDTLLERILSGYTLGVNNTAVGFKAGAHFGSKMDGDIAASDENVAVGNLSMFWTAGVSSGYSKGRNTAVGQSTLFRNISGSYNVAIGIFALEDNNKGDANTAVGDGALRSNIDGDFNAAVGGSAMVYNSTGVINCTIVSGGLGYSVGDTITFSAPLSNGPGTCYGVAGGRVLTVDGSGTITSVEIPTPGCGYSSRGGTFANMAYHPPVTATVGGAGSGASLTPVLSSGSRNTALGILAGAYNVLGQDMIYVGYGSGTGARQWDRKSTFIGVGSGIDASVSAVDSIDKAITIGYGATTTCDNCAVIGGTGSNAVRLGMGTITPAASSILDLTSTTQGVLIPRMTSAQRTAIGSPATGLMVWDTDQARLYNYGGLSWLPYAYSNEWGTSAGTTGTKHYIPMWNGSDDFIDSRMMEITNGTGDFISIDDNQTGSTTTNNFLFNVRNSYAGDATASTNPLVFFGSNSSSISILPILKMQASNMPTSSSIMYGIGKTSATKNMYFGSFQYNSNGGNDNYFEHQFAGSANQGRMYTSGNWTIGSSVTADNGYKLEVGGSIRNHSFWETADISLPSTPGSGFGRVFVRTDSLRFVNDVGTEFTLGASAGATGLTVGTTTITSGTDGRILRNNAGVLGEYTVTGSGTEAVLSTSPTFVTSITSPIVYGSSAANGDLNLNGTSNGTTATSSVNIQASGGNVGIGTSSPGSSVRAEILGDATYPTMLKLSHAGTPTSFLELSSVYGTVMTYGSLFQGVEALISQAGGTFRISQGARHLTAWTQSLINFNDNNNDVDFVVEGQTDQNLIYVDASANNVGIGVSSPTAKLHLPAGTATAGTAPLKLTTGTSLTAAVAGAVEYTTPQLFFTNGRAIRQEIPQIQQARVSTQYDNTTTTLGNVTGLTTNVAASGTYRFEARLYTTSNVSGGIKTAIGGTATATAIVYEGITTDAGLITQSRANALGTAVGAVTAVTASYVLIVGTITVNAAGTLTVQAAANAAVGTTSVLVGSTFVITEML